MLSDPGSAAFVIPQLPLGDVAFRLIENVSHYGVLITGLNHFSFRLRPASLTAYA